MHPYYPAYEACTATVNKIGRIKVGSLNLSTKPFRQATYYDV